MLRTDGILLVRDQQRVGAHSSGGRARLGARMSATDDDHIVRPIVELTGEESEACWKSLMAVIHVFTLCLPKISANIPVEERLLSEQCSNHRW